MSQPICTALDFEIPDDEAWDASPDCRWRLNVECPEKVISCSFRKKALIKKSTPFN
ncbi:hypothetical protein JW998_16690 [candidate division KSB1 bacterium]|nr:hypothetical protein [candidate division KSB1 bacterium]